jgi:hypothetical protein
MPLSWESEKAEALARNSRFVEEFVEDLNVCPYAKGSRMDGSAQRRVAPVSNEDLTADHPDIAAAFHRIADEPGVEVMQIICPRIAMPEKEWTLRVKEMTETLHQAHGRSVVGVAAFHPDLKFRDESAASLVPLFRRAPDPTIQWIRLDVIERVRSSRPAGDIAIPTDEANLAEFLKRQLLPSVEAEIAATNARLVDNLGLEAILQLLQRFRR